MDSVDNSLLVLASSDTPVLVHDTGTELALRRDSAAIARWAGAQPDDGRLSLLLDQVQGTHDATALHMSMRLPEADAPQPTAAQDILLASAALYGLRRASIARSGQQGLTLHLDITAQAARLRPLLVASADAPLILVIRARPTLPVGVKISMARVCIACNTRRTA